MNNDNYHLTTYGGTPTPARRLLWVLGAILLVGLLVLTVVWWMGCATPTPPPVTKTETLPPAKPAVDYAGQYYYGGMPQVTTYPNPLQILTNIGYVVGYDNQRRDPAWCCYKLSKVSSLRPPPRPKGFAVDMRTRARVNTRDYTGSGYDRGHNAPNRAIGICFGEQAQLETFLMSNILPESKPLNEQVWEHLETSEILNYAQRYGSVWVITGPVFGVEGKQLVSGVVVPDACYKILVREDDGKPSVLAFEIPQSVHGNEEVGDFLQPVRKIEQDTGLDFMGELPAEVQNRLEAQRAKRMW